MILSFATAYPILIEASENELENVLTIIKFLNSFNNGKAVV